MTDRTSKVIVDALENCGCQPTCDARSLDAVREAIGSSPAPMEVEGTTSGLCEPLSKLWGRRGE